jgi:hypothetical protein
MINKKLQIEVREKGTSYGVPGRIVEVISRKPWLEEIGNFNPMFCRYKGKRTLVQSLAGDLSDPFRREENYKETLFIEI